MRKRLKRNPILHLSIETWHRAKGRRKVIAVSTAMTLAAMGIALCTPLVVGRLMNVVQAKQGEALRQGVIQPLALFVLVGLVFWLLHGPSRIMEMSTSFFVRNKILTGLFGNVTALPMKWQRCHHSGKTIDQVNKATAALEEFAEDIHEVIYMLLRLAGSIIILACFQPWAGVAMVCVTALIVAVIVLFDRVLIKQYDALNKRYNAVAALVQDFLTNVSTVISLRLEERAGREVRNRTQAIHSLASANWRINELKWFITCTLINLSQAGVLFGYVAMTAGSADARIEVGTFYALYAYLRAIGESFQQFTWKYGDLVVKSARIRNAEHIEKAFDDLARADLNARLPENWKQLQVRSLNFAHDQEAKEQFKIAALDLDLARGERIAFVGESGSGKSTVLSLLRGIHPAKAAKVFCDGRLLEQQLAHVSHHCTLIPQEPEIFSGTIRFNISLGIEADEKAMLDAIKLARFDSVLKRLPRGLDTDVAEKGVRLSGGERQRLALARGIFFAEESGSDILLLDEPTSSVDQMNEWLIYEALSKRFSDRCIISALHKLSLLPLFDEVVVFSGGRIVERGNPDRVLERNGELARLSNVRPREMLLVQ